MYWDKAAYTGAAPVPVVNELNVLRQAAKVIVSIRGEEVVAMVIYCLRYPGECVATMLRNWSAWGKPGYHGE